jgi:hypothetical protein
MWRANIAVARGRIRPHIGTMGEKHPKRPRDLNQWAKRMVDLATGQASDPTPPERPAGKVKGGKAGGPARAAKLSPERRAEIAKKAAQSRWKTQNY